MNIRRNTRKDARPRWFTALLATGSIMAGVVASGPAVAEPQPATPSVSASPHVAVSATSLNLGVQRVGTSGRFKFVTLSNQRTTPLVLKSINFRSGNRQDFVGATTCFPHGRPATLAPGASCVLGVRFVPRALGTRTATLTITEESPPGPGVRRMTVRGIGTEGYFMAGTRGGVGTFGDAVFHGRVGPALAASIVSITATPNGAGYWLLGADGGVFAEGNARFYGSTGGLRLNQPVVGMAATRSGKGYWLVASDGGIFTFGLAPFFGSTGAMRLNQPVVGMAPTRSGKGYWLVAADGGIFTFGDARFFGSTGAIHLNRPIVAMEATTSGKGYWLVASDGGIFTFGDARFFGSLGAFPPGTITGMASTPDSRGYWLSTTMGAVYVFGNAPYYGDLFTHGIFNAAGFAATAPKLRPTLFAGAVLDVPRRSAVNAVPQAEPRLDGG